MYAVVSLGNDSGRVADEVATEHDFSQAVPLVHQPPRAVQESRHVVGLVEARDVSEPGHQQVTLRWNGSERVLEGLPRPDLQKLVGIDRKYPVRVARAEQMTDEPIHDRDLVERGSLV